MNPNRKIALTHRVTLTNTNYAFERVNIEENGTLIATLDVKKTSNRSHKLIYELAEQGSQMLEEKGN